MLKLQDVRKTYTAFDVATVAVEGVSLHVKVGEFLAIMGPSGCGKTSLLNMMGLLDMPTAGEVYFADQAVSLLKPGERTAIRRMNIGFVFQNFNLIEELNIYENIELPLLYRKVPVKERKARVMEVMEQMNIAHKRHFFPQQLSGGQQQRVAVSRAVIGNPKLILADEPTGNLDSAHGEEVMNTLQRLNENGTTVVIVTHSPLNANYAQRVVHLFDGHIVSDSLR